MSVMMGYSGGPGSPGGPSGGDLYSVSEGGRTLSSTGLPDDGGPRGMPANHLQYEDDLLPQHGGPSAGAIMGGFAGQQYGGEAVCPGDILERADDDDDELRGAEPLLEGERPRRRRRRRSPPNASFDINDNSLCSVYNFFKSFIGASAASTVAIDNKIEQAMDLVKSHLMFAVREEVDVLKDRIGELLERISQLECENTVLRQHATQEALQQLQQAHHSSNT